MSQARSARPGQAFSCEDYTMDQWTPDGTCEELAGEECGDQVPGCAGLGWVACGYSDCDSGEVTMICQFSVE